MNLVIRSHRLLAKAGLGFIAALILVLIVELSRPERVDVMPRMNDSVEATTTTTVPPVRNP